MNKIDDCFNDDEEDGIIRQCVIGCIVAAIALITFITISTLVWNNSI